MTSRLPGLALLAFLQIANSSLEAGEIPGLPSQAPPFLERKLEINFSNDFLGRGGSVDDFRTQQINVTGALADKWFAVVDHSILTLGDPVSPGRLDQMSVSVGYEAIYRADSNRVDRLTIGGGLRGVGDYAGARMQNGFHQLVDSDIQTMDYVGTDRTDGTLWFDAQHYRVFHESAAKGFFGGWRTGYWFRGSSLLTTDGQWDNALSAYAVSSRSAVDVWLGLRRDWRSGYDRDPVQAATAAAESELGVVVGVRIGALILETLQQPDGEASYGQLKFIASGARALKQQSTPSTVGLEFGFFLPDVTVELAARFRHGMFTLGDSSWNESLVVDASFGTPQYGNNTSVFIEGRQLSLGIEWERPLAADNDWISFYADLGGGYRDEKLRGEGLLSGETSSSVGRAVVNLGTGLRFNSASLSDSWNYRLQIGIGGWMPVKDAQVQLANETYRIQKPVLGISLGMTFDYY
jgi:hypothetical protein